MIRKHHGEETAPTLEIQSTEHPAFESPAHGDVPRPGAVKFARGTLIDRYVLLEHVGAGAMGVVYGAYDPELDRKIALKFLKSHGARPQGPRAADPRGPGAGQAWPTPTSSPSTTSAPSTRRCSWPWSTSTASPCGHG